MAEASTKNLVDISLIRDGIVLLKNGSLRCVIEVSAMNFELRSRDEQTAIIQNFQNFLNSIDFPIQISILSRNLSLDDYLVTLNSAIDGLDNELLKIQASEYSKFVSELADLSNIMTKKFYVIVPFYALSVPSASGVFSSVKELFGKKKVEKIDDSNIEKYSSQLMQRVDLVIGNLIGLGLKADLLKDNDLMTLYYQLYNPDSKRKF